MRRELRAFRWAPSSTALGWGLADQVSSSATNFLLTIAAARMLGAQGLGVVALGFTAYLTLLGLQRALISQPLVASTAAEAASERRTSSQSALTLALVCSVGFAALLACSGAAIGGALGRAFLLFAPWILPALVQDYWRATLFRDSRGAAAAANDTSWLIVTALALVGAWAVGTDWAVVSAWGLGALVSAATGFVQTGLRPSALRPAIRFWRAELLPFGRWLLAGAVTYGLTGQATVILTAEILGPAALGGLRSVQTMFAPLTLLLPGIGLPALPIMVRRLRKSVRDARTFAMGVSGLLATLTGVYVAIVSLGGEQLIGSIFGSSFEQYGELILPVAVGQVIAAFGGGFNLLLQAGRRGRAIFGVYAATVPFTLAFVPLGAESRGLVGVAWGIAAAQSLWVATGAVVAMKGARRTVPSDYWRRPEPRASQP